MTNSENQVPAAVAVPGALCKPEPLTEVQKMQNLLRSTVAQLMAHSQTVNELMKANMDLRAALHLSQTDKNVLDEHINRQLNPAPVETSIAQEPIADANPVSV